MTGYDDLKKMWLEHELTIRKLKRYGDVYFVHRDSSKGADTNNGEQPTSPLLTLNAAVDKCTERNNDTIIFSGRTTSGQAFSDYQSIDVRGLHLLGAGFLFGALGFDLSTYVCYHTPTAHGLGFGSPAGLLVEADSVEIAGIKFYNPDATKIQTEVGLNCDGDPGDGRACSIHDNEFQGQTGGTTDRTRGIELIGSESTIVEKNRFYCCEYGIYLRGGSTRYAEDNIIQDNRIHSPKYGIYVDTTVAECQFLKNRISQKSILGYAMTVGITIPAASGNLFAENIVGHATKGNAFSPGTGTNYWINNYYSGSGGTLYDGT